MTDAEKAILEELKAIRKMLEAIQQRPFVSSPPVVPQRTQ